MERQAIEQNSRSGGRPSLLRLFVAAEIPDPVARAVAELMETLDPERRRARWVRPEAMHLTLKFLGEVDAGRLDEIDRALRSVRGAAFNVIVSGVGFFPGARSPRVLWVGVTSMDLPAGPAGDDQTRPLAGIARQIEQRMEEVGFPPDGRRFHPHLTVARSGRERRLDSRLVEGSASFRDRIFGEFAVRAFALFESRLKPAGAEYRKLEEYPLDGPPQ